MAKQKPQYPPRTAIVRNIQRLSHARNTYDVWSDWLAMMALAFRNAVDRDQHWQDRENRYLDIVKRYSRDEVTLLSESMACLIVAMDESPGDLLGSIFMELELGNANMGQFFTPYDVCRMIARMTIEGNCMADRIDRRGFITVSEPACGGGAMIIAFAAEMLDRGFNPQQQLHVTAVDLDIKAVHMAYIQLSLLHIPAVIIYGNALTLEVRDQWFTPAHIMGGWSRKLNRTEVQWRAIIDTINGSADSEVVAANDNEPENKLLVLPSVGETFSLF